MHRYTQRETQRGLLFFAAVMLATFIGGLVDLAAGG